LAAHELVDVVERNKECRLTFHLPPEGARTSLCPGNLVKLIFDDRERMWVRVREVAGVKYRGVLVSRPAVLRTIEQGDVVDFGPEHVADIYSEGS